jgi:hypothetical protein
MPPLLRFDRAIENVEDALDGESPGSFERLVVAYRKLVTADERSRAGLVSDFKTYLNAAEEDFGDTNRTVARWLESMQNRVDLYLRTRRRKSEMLHLVSGRLYERSADGDTIGEPVTDVTKLQAETATFRARVSTRGERAAAVVRVAFYYNDDSGRVLVRSEELPMGYVDGDETKTLETSVYVPSIAESFDAVVLDPADGQTFLTDVDAVRSGRS